MFKKINNIIFITLFLAALFLPLLFTRWESGGISEEENRNLAAFPSLTADGGFNRHFTSDFETWFRDHMGFRYDLITANKDLQQTVFDRSLTQSDDKIGKTGDRIYATDAIIKDFAHVNLRTEAEVRMIGESYQTVSEHLAEKEIPFYYVQCVDKHTIYPERFISSIIQVGDVSKTDQVLNYLQNQTAVNAVYFKQVLADNRYDYDVFSHWGDATHWTDRGAYLSYLHLMEQLSKNVDEPLRILTEADYEITRLTYYSFDGASSEQIEKFTVKAPNAQKGDVSVMGTWATDERHSVWHNPAATNSTRLLVMGDSYFNNHLIDDIAESFREVWMVWGDYTNDLPEIVALCDPDLVIYECAERVDRSSSVCELAEKLRGMN